MNSEQRLLLDHERIDVMTQRLACEIREQHGNFDKTALVGLQPRGIYFARRLHRILCEMTQNSSIKYGELDTTFYRDDFRRGNEILQPSSLSMDFLVEEMNIILVDDVLFTGRTIRAAMDALNDFGRPASVQLVTLVDRRYNRELPVQPDFTGCEVDTRANEKVRVEWNQETGNKIWLIKSQPEPKSK